MIDRNSPDFNDFLRNIVNDPKKAEITRQSVYDFLLYPTAGQTAPFVFFSQQQGQGISSSSGNAANTKGLADTNMTLSGQLSVPNWFLCDGIEVDFQPGSVSTANTYTIQPPSGFNTDDAATVQAGEADVNAVLSGGVCQLIMNSKAYFVGTPLLMIPPSRGFVLDVALGNISATTPGLSVKAKMRSAGMPQIIDPPLTFEPGVNFSVPIQYPAAIATPSGFNGRLGVLLQGWMVRPLQ